MKKKKEREVKERRKREKYQTKKKKVDVVSSVVQSEMFQSGVDFGNRLV